jgi:PTS system nitrogen regulatory IIA component
MNIADLMPAKNVLTHLRPASKDEFLRELSLLAPPDPGLTGETVLKALLAREALGSTGMGKGVAMPHASIKHLKKPFAAFVRLERPVAYGAVDEKPVDLVFLLLTPEGGSRENIAALAAMSRRLRDEKVVRAIRAARTAQGIYQELIA